VGPLEVGDQVHLARYLLHRLGEDFNIVATFNPKPMKGDWNGEQLIHSTTSSLIYQFIKLSITKAAVCIVICDASLVLWTLPIWLHIIYPVVSSTDPTRGNGLFGI